MDARGWCMRPASAVAAPVLSASSVNGRAVPPKSLARSACCSILSWLAQRLSCGVIGVAGDIDVPASSSCAERRVDVQHGHDPEVRAAPSLPVLSRAQRARYRLSFAERLARNARVSSASRPLITLFGVPETFSAFLGLSAT